MIEKLEAILDQYDIANAGVFENGLENEYSTIAFEIRDKQLTSVIEIKKCISDILSEYYGLEPEYLNAERFKLLVVDICKLMNS